MAMSELEYLFEMCWKAAKGPALVREHVFHPTRQWRFDFAHLESKTAFEVEGGTWSGGAHTRGKHFQSDCEKYNAAQLLGWRVFRFSTSMVEPERLKVIISGLKLCPPSPPSPLGTSVQPLL